MDSTQMNNAKSSFKLNMFVQNLMFNACCGIVWDCSKPKEYVGTNLVSHLNLTDDMTILF